MHDDNDDPDDVIPNFCIDLDNPDVEITLFRVLLSYTEGQFVVVVTHDGWILHGIETCRLLAGMHEDPKSGSAIGMLIPTVDAAEIRDAFETSSWPDLLDTAFRGYMEGKKSDPRYLEWIEREIDWRIDGGEPNESE